RKEFADRVFALEAGDVSPVFEFDRGFCLVKVHEKTTERQDPFEKVKDRIRVQLTPTFNDSLLQAGLARLHHKEKPQILFGPATELAGKSADELMRQATESQNPLDKIEYYRALLKKYPTYERADEAQFMIGFVYSEELHDCARAKPEYEAVLKNYPASSIRESAQYMIQNLCQHTLPPGLGNPTGATTPNGN